MGFFGSMLLVGVLVASYNDINPRRGYEPADNRLDAAVQAAGRELRADNRLGAAVHGHELSADDRLDAAVRAVVQQERERTADRLDAAVQAVAQQRRVSKNIYEGWIRPALWAMGLFGLMLLVGVLVAYNNINPRRGYEPANNRLDAAVQAAGPELRADDRLDAAVQAAGHELSTDRLDAAVQAAGHELSADDRLDAAVQAMAQQR